jgi:hypothetical protein
MIVEKAVELLSGLSTLEDFIKDFEAGGFRVITHNNKVMDIKEYLEIWEEHNGN